MCLSALAIVSGNSMQRTLHKRAWYAIPATGGGSSNPNILDEVRMMMMPISDIRKTNHGDSQLRKEVLGFQEQEKRSGFSSTVKSLTVNQLFSENASALRKSWGERHCGAAVWRGEQNHSEGINEYLEAKSIKTEFKLFSRSTENQFKEHVAYSDIQSS